MERAYATTFTAAELAFLADYANSEIGRRVQKKMPNYVAKVGTGSLFDWFCIYDVGHLFILLFFHLTPIIAGAPGHEGLRDRDL